MNTFTAVMHHRQLWTPGSVNTIGHVSHPMNTWSKWYSSHFSQIPVVFTMSFCHCTERHHSDTLFFFSRYLPIVSWHFQRVMWVAPFVASVCNVMELHGPIEVPDSKEGSVKPNDPLLNCFWIAPIASSRNFRQMLKTAYSYAPANVTLKIKIHIEILSPAVCQWKLSDNSL